MKKLHLTVHDASPVHKDILKLIHSTLIDLGVVRYSMLVIPDYHGKWLLDEYPDFCGWLQELERTGVEMVLHGCRHAGGNASMRTADRVRSAIFTRGEGEFLGLDESEAGKLLYEGSEILKRVLNIEVKGFVAPAWLYSGGTIAALKKREFTTAENRMRIWNPETGRTILRMPVVNFAGGGLFKRSLAAFWVRISGMVLEGSETVRFAIHPCDFENDAVRKAIVNRLKTLLRKRKAVGFCDLLPVS